MTVLILTPLPLEYAAVIKHLRGERETIFKDQAAYEVGQFRGKHHTYKVVVREPGMKNVDMALATEKAIQTFKPQIALLIGIAGGVKDVRIGDLLIAKKAYGYESGKEDADGYKSRPAVESFSAELLARAQALSRGDNWKKRTADGAPEATVFLGPIAAGDKVVAGTDNPTFQRLKDHYNDTLGLEMEAIGFATATQAHRDVHSLVIRGISDLCAGKAETDKQNWQPVAAERAAGFGFELLYKLNGNDFISGQHPALTLTKKQAQELAQVLHKYPLGPAVKAFLIAEKLIKSYASRVRLDDVEVVISNANAIRRSADPNATIIDSIHIVPKNFVSPGVYWQDVFKEARLHGPRMVASMLLAVPDDLFEPEAQEIRRDLLDFLLLN